MYTNVDWDAVNDGHEHIDCDDPDFEDQDHFDHSHQIILVILMKTPENGESSEKTHSASYQT